MNVRTALWVLTIIFLVFENNIILLLSILYLVMLLLFFDKTIILVLFINTCELYQRGFRRAT